ncbi:hypothetical protein POSPLADRAFT_1142164, partial [Postia placenta MAD-698-R-SB12]
GSTTSRARLMQVESSGQCRMCASGTHTLTSKAHSRMCASGKHTPMSKAQITQMLRHSCKKSLVLAQAILRLRALAMSKAGGHGERVARQRRDTSERATKRGMNDERDEREEREEAVEMTEGGGGIAFTSKSAERGRRGPHSRGSSRRLEEAARDLCPNDIPKLGALEAEPNVYALVWVRRKLDGLRNDIFVSLEEGIAIWCDSKILRQSKSSVGFVDGTLGKLLCGPWGVSVNVKDERQRAGHNPLSPPPDLTSRILTLQRIRHVERALSSAIRL